MGLFDRPASHRPSRVTILVAAALAVVVLGGLTYLAAVAPRGVPGLSYYKLDAQFQDSADLRLLSEVAVAGRRVGQVSQIRSVDGITHVELQLMPGTTRLLSDTTARIRLKNPVGAKYVALTPGSAGAPLPSGGVIPRAQTSTSVDTPELLSGFDARTRANLRRTVVGLGAGFLGRGQALNEALPRGGPMLSDLRDVSDAILARPGAAARFAPSTSALAQAYDPVREELASGFRPEARVLEAFAGRRTNLQRILDEAPPALSALRQGLARAQPLLDETAGFARAATQMTRTAPAALQQTTALLREGGPALRRSRPLLHALGQAVPPTLSLLRQLDPVIDATRRALHNQLRPLIEVSSRPCDFFTWGTNWRSALAFGVPAETDPSSDLDHAQGIGPNNNSFRVLGVPLDDSESLAADSPQADIRAGRNPYPPACTAPSDRLP